MKRVLRLAGAAALCVLLLSGCGKKEQAATGGDWTVSLNTLTQEPQFLDRTQNSTKMQLIALRDENGQVRLAYNTCQICAGSPYAYFEYKDGVLECQNCGNQFPLSSVGQAAGGCNPMPVADYQVTEEAAVIPETEVTRAAADFANWKKGL